MKIAVVGTGYLGLVPGAVPARLGSAIVSVDKEEEKLNKVGSGTSPINELGIKEMLREVNALLILTLMNSVPVETAGA